MPDETVHVAYCHSPTRYLWDQTDQYLADEVPAPLRGVVREMFGALREFDLRAAARVDRWIANSEAVRERITRYYGAPSEVIPPPVEVSRYRPVERGDFWLFAPGRLVAYKRGDIAVDVFDRIGLRLIVLGDGRERRALERRARDNVTFAGRVDDDTVRELLGAARGLIFPGEDDFGIVCVEALASGAPVVALGAGGAREIVRDGIDGALVPTADVDAFEAAVLSVERRTVDRDELRRRAALFDRPRFEERVRATVERAHARGRVAVTTP
jgi:glycosyltransferase involved in cell wall biosynthesis